MKKTELSAWTLIFGATVFGSITSVLLSGCKPPETPGSIEITTEDLELDFDQGEIESNNTTTGVAETPAVEMPAAETPATEKPAAEAPATETPADAAPEVKMSAEKAPPATKPAAVEPAAAEPAAPETKAAPPEKPAEKTSSKPASAESSLVATKADASEAVALKAILSSGGDWPQWGGTRLRNNVPNVTGLPESWNIGKFDRKTGEWAKEQAENIRWYANLGSQTYGNPVISGGKVFVGTNNGAGYLKRYPATVDLGCLLAFDESNGEFLWQHSSEKLITGRVHDWPLQGICSASLVEGNRLWFVTSRGEVRCVDTEGFHDGEDNGPVKDEVVNVADIMNAGPGAKPYADTLAALGEGKLSDAAKQALDTAGEPLAGEATLKTLTEGKVWAATGNFGGVDRTITIKAIGPKLMFTKTLGVHDKRDADTLWVYDMMSELGTSQHNMASCSVTSYGDLLFVNTSNGLDESHLNLPAPDAASFICLNKNTGELYWTDNAPGTNILHGQWSSPMVAEFDGVPQVLFAGGDGYLYSYKADQGKDGKPELLWKFDANPKETKWILGGEGTRNNIIATPVAYDGLVYVAVGQDPEHGEGEGHLWCIDPNKRGDVSPQLAVKIEDDGTRTPIAHRRIQAVDPKEGEAAIDNPNSAVVWHYTMADQNDDGEFDFEEKMHRSCGTVAIKDDILYIADFSGLVHCLNAKPTDEGMPTVYFTYDMFAQSWGSPLITDGRVFIGDEDGDVAIFEFGPENKEPLEEINMGTSVYSTPVAANGTIYISTKDKLFAIGKIEE
ncbi:outer membrane biogenesis protein BamB [Novipirellula galeiformis]|uniref:Outer membrane biogenesis protein BamB n=2 Tax=Novipirellula galeiformis TaxID=2528004 RepID=A0A5C6CF20_9BACT|nr:PQQ-binding-like beta-propeller repeat protein [Novipirellula galeiformis]TWU22114.1 outer membrane biogenesis protein BamB [Novipirellula galeiformis]